MYEFFFPLSIFLYTTTKNVQQFSLYYYTDYILYGTVYNSRTHPVPQERKDALFSIVDGDIYQLDTDEGNYE